jgi:hypothetical protein
MTDKPGTDDEKETPTASQPGWPRWRPAEPPSGDLARARRFSGTPPPNQRGAIDAADSVPDSSQPLTPAGAEDGT